MRISDDRVEWTKKEIIRNVAGSIILLLAVFLWDNRDYLFQYRLHESQYMQVPGRIEGRRSRKSGSRIVVQLPNGERSVWLPQALDEFIPLRENIPMVYSPVREPQICRGSLVITVHLLILLMIVVLWNKYQLWI